MKSVAWDAAASRHKSTPDSLLRFDFNSACNPNGRPRQGMERAAPSPQTASVIMKNSPSRVQVAKLALIPLLDFGPCEQLIQCVGSIGGEGWFARAFLLGIAAVVNGRPTPQGVGKVIHPRSLPSKWMLIAKLVEPVT